MQPASFPGTVLPCFAALVASLGVPARAQDAGEARSYLVGKREVKLSVELDAVGIVFDEDAKARFSEELVPLLPPGATHVPPRAWDEKNEKVRGLEALVHRVVPAGAFDADGLGDVARDLLKLNSGSIEHAGVLVRFAGATDSVLMTREIVVQLRENVTEAEAAAVLARFGWVEVERSAFVRNLLLVETPPESDDDALEACERLAALQEVDYCEPNFVHAVEYLSTSAPDGLDDPLLARQWHHDNDGRDEGSFDADIDSVKAWGITTGSPDVVIAVLEDGFDVGHPDLAPNLWCSPDDPSVHGWDFEENDADVLGDPGDPGATSHGTAVAGCAGACGNNGVGVAGSCPVCRLMLVRRRAPTDYFHDAEAISWAWNHGADVITNSWTYGEKSPIPEVVRRAIDDALTEGRGGLGTVVLFATRNTDVDVEAIEDIASVPGVLTVGAATNTDQRTRACGSGPCLDVLGPSRLSSAPNFTEGTLDVVTTDWRGLGVGYNHDDAVLPEKDDGWPPCEDLGGDGDYTACFGGTSAATPIVAGVVGLVLSVAPELERAEIHRLLRDTTDHVQDSTAKYDARTGESSVHSHGHGRVNAFEAVRVVAPAELGGRGGIDVFVRDHELDWGNTEQPSSFLFEKVRGTIGPWASPDVRVQPPPFDAALPTPAAFDALALRNATPGAKNRVLVRVRNRGPHASGPVNVTVLWTESALVLPPLPDGFWSGATPGSGIGSSGAPGTWRSLGTRTIESVPYCAGAGLADGDADAAPVVGFDLVAPLAVPGEALVEAGAGEGEVRAVPPSAEAGEEEPEGGLVEAGPTGTAARLAYLVLVDGADDRAGGDAPGTLDVLRLVTLDNDVALCNRRVTTSDQTVPLMLRNPSDQPVQVRLELDVADGTTARIEALGPEGPATELPTDVPYELAAGAELPVRVCLEGAPGRVELRQWNDDVLVGGLVLE